MREPDEWITSRQFYIGKDGKQVVAINYPEYSSCPISVSSGDLEKDTDGTDIWRFAEYPINTNKAQLLLKLVDLRFVDGKIQDINVGAEKA